LTANEGSKGRVELFERGYGKDAAGIAKEAITFGIYFFYFGRMDFQFMDIMQPRRTTLMLF